MNGRNGKCREMLDRVLSSFCKSAAKYATKEQQIADELKSNERNSLKYEESKKRGVHALTTTQQGII